MTNEQTIDEIMEHVFRSRTFSARDAITAALAAKDAEIAELKQRLADSGCDLQALKADPAPGEWIEWKGGECPIEDGVEFQLKLRNGETFGPYREASVWLWRDRGHPGDIVAYRVLP